MELTTNKKFKYQLVYFDHSLRPPQIQSKLNELGSQGWELIFTESGFWNCNIDSYKTFKREIYESNI